MKIITDKQELPIIMSAEDLQAIGFSRPMVYKLLCRADVPVVKIGKRKFVERDSFFAWLRTQNGDAANN